MASRLDEILADEWWERRQCMIDAEDVEVVRCPECWEEVIPDCRHYSWLTCPECGNEIDGG